MVPPATRDRFLEFIRRSQWLLDGSGSGPRPIVRNFLAFVDRASPAATTHLRRDLDRLAPRAALLRRWLAAHDLLQIAGQSAGEGALTRLVAWALYPPGHPDAALRCQRAWLTRLRVVEARAFDRAAEPREHAFVKGGAPHLVLDWADRTLIVEAGAVTPAPPRQGQRPVTASAARAALGIAQHKPLHLIYLTADRAEPANPEALPASYVDLALALARALDGILPPSDLRAAYAMLITHLATCAAPPGLDVADVLSRAEAWTRAPEASGMNAILPHSASVQRLATLISPEEEE